MCFRMITMIMYGPPHTIIYGFISLNMVIWDFYMISYCFYLITYGSLLWFYVVLIRFYMVFMWFYMVLMCLFADSIRAALDVHTVKATPRSGFRASRLARTHHPSPRSPGGLTTASSSQTGVGSRAVQSRPCHPGQWAATAHRVLHSSPSAKAHRW